MAEPPRVRGVSGLRLLLESFEPVIFSFFTVCPLMFGDNPEQDPAEDFFALGWFYVDILFLLQQHFHPVRT